MSPGSRHEILKNIASSLACPIYWEKVHNEWTIISYYIKLIEKSPTVTKRIATSLLKDDLNKLHVTFISDKDVKKKIETLQVEAKKSTTILAEFWNNHSETLKKIALENSVSEARVVCELKRKGTDTIAESSTSTSSTSASTTTITPAPQKRPRTRQSKKKGKEVAHEDQPVESDNVFVTDCNISVGTMIKRAAYQLHEKNQPMSCRERKIMTSGLSSILDLSDNSFDSQRSLFTNEQWNELHKRYDPLFETAIYKLDEQASDFIKIACCTLELSNDYNCVLKSLRKSQERLTNVSQVALKIAEHILSLTKSYQYLLTQNPTKNVTELDYYCTIWSPIFLMLFPPSGHVRVKVGESINTFSTTNKKELYHESRYAKAFKIDFRFLTDMQGEEYDIGLGECALDSSDSKAIKDEGKLTREAKDAVDKVLKTVDEKVNTKIWMMQTSGHSCSISMLDIFDVGLYVTKHKYTFQIPNTIMNFNNNIKTILSYLLTMQRDISTLGDSIASSPDPEPTSDDTFNREQIKSALNPRLQYTRDTYYTPPKGAASKVPYHFYGPPPPSILNKLESLSGTDYVTRPVEGDKRSYDVYGYTMNEDGTYYNKYTKTITDVHPML